MERRRNHTSGRAVRRLAAATATTMLATALAVGVGEAAAAAPPGGCVLQVGYQIDGNQNIHARRLWACENGDIILLPVAIQRYVSPNVWNTVSSGTGFTSYYCNGHALNIYRTTGKPQFFNTCG